MRNHTHREWPAHWPEMHDPDTPEDATVPAADGLAWLLEHFADMMEEQHSTLHRTADGYTRVRVYSVRYTWAGDYVGGFVERANLDVLLEDIAPSILSRHFEMYGTEFAAIYGPDRPEDPWPEGADRWPLSELHELAEALDSLSEYPVLDEQAWSDLEWSAIQDAWREFWEGGLEHALGRIDESEPEDFPWLPPRPAPEYILDIPRITEYGTDVWAADNDNLWDLHAVEGLSVWIDADSVAAGILTDYVGDGRDPWVVAPLYDPNSSEFYAPGAVGKRAARFNREAAELRTEALRTGSNFDPMGWAP